MICRYNGTEIEVDDKIIGGFKEYVTGEKEVKKRMFRLSSGQEIYLDDELVQRYEKTVRSIYKDQLEVWISEKHLTDNIEKGLEEKIASVLEERTLNLDELEDILSRRHKQ